jgi:hypothetical protein
MVITAQLDGDHAALEPPHGHQPLTRSRPRRSHRPHAIVRTSRCAAISAHVMAEQATRLPPSCLPRPAHHPVQNRDPRHKQESPH